MGLEMDLVLVLQRCRTDGAGQKLKYEMLSCHETGHCYVHDCGALLRVMFTLTNESSRNYFTVPIRTGLGFSHTYQ
jgi:hypothetical protein